jgi:hypothetical protein
MLFIKSCKASCLYIQEAWHSPETRSYFYTPLFAWGLLLDLVRKFFMYLIYNYLMHNFWNKWSDPYWIRLVAFSAWVCGRRLRCDAPSPWYKYECRKKPIIANTVRFFCFKRNVWLLINRCNSYSLNFYP